jgi:hypothetical protein
VVRHFLLVAGDLVGVWQLSRYRETESTTNSVQAIDLLKYKIFGGGASRANLNESSTILGGLRGWSGERVTNGRNGVSEQISILIRASVPSLSRENTSISVLPCGEQPVHSCFFFHFARNH